MPITKTVRFAQVVEMCGQPEPYTLWVAPEADREFQRALKAHRVMSVRQDNVGSKADFGEVGYSGALGELLLFPKSLKSFEGRRIVGVNYDLLQKPKAEAAARKSTRPVKPAVIPKKSKASPNIVPFPMAEAPKSKAKEKPAEKSAQALVVAAMKALKAGKEVAAYELLQKLKGMV